MNDEDMTDNGYHTYLEQKQSQFGVSPEIVEKAIEKATNSESLVSTRIIAGEVNEVYGVGTNNGDFIVRISHGESDRFSSEKWAIDKAREKGVPAPQVLLIEEVEDKKKKVRVSVETKLPGIALGASNLPENETKAVVLEAGEILAKIHSVAPKKFGRISDEGVGELESWESFMLRPTQPPHLQNLLDSAQKAGIAKEQIDQALKILTENKDVYKDVTPHLLHGDYGPKHILVEGGKISGILDFENATSGDPTYDFAWWSYFWKNRPPIDWLKEGYEKEGKLPDNFDLKLRLGRIRLGMDMIWYYVNEQHEMGLQIAKNNLQEDLDYFDKL